ncbi:MAG TPA: tetratricopeptide repeat protein [Planctomycetota bacterium]|jgi:tetratricopeptide (TPR) repeat protein|nr:tetratricopeptide repeat protein [Planctomycetota bacterium]OQC21678.1 MAG: tetratricopeptide repeat protein [Planctomycetes bacterium ADurb.Bin069]HNR98942.1 tetratricopeptide repeat protein [Planctomycetota bacterium]HNU26446.1 tetratricopeptide repeat protein [Planctomycetota bacterium]HOE29648.1 tetratricopeptide repeat protein [Planctomycetota bacterium]
MGPIRFIAVAAVALGLPLRGQEAPGTAALKALLDAPSERIDLYAGVLLLGAQAGRAVPPHLDYLLRLTKAAGESIAAGDGSHAACLAAAAGVVFGAEGFRADHEDLSLEALTLPRAIEQKRGPPIMIVVLVLAALRDAPAAAQVICAGGRYFVRMGPAGQERFLDVESGRVAAPGDPLLRGARLEGAPALSTRQILGHYALCLGRAAQRERRDALAGRFLKIAWHLAPQNPELYVVEGRRALLRWELAKAERCFVRALRLDPVLRDGHVGMAEIFVRQRRLNEAASALEKAFAADREDPEALRVRGELFLAKGDFRAAQDLFERFAQWKPQDPRAWSGLALAHIGRNNRAGARAALAQAEARAPAGVETQFAAGEILAHEQDLDRAFTAFRKTIEANARFAPGYLRRGAIYEAWNVPGAALRDYRMCLELLELPREHPFARDIAARIAKLRADLGAEGPGEMR